MVNLGVLGDVSVGKTTILRLFVSYIENKALEKGFKTGPVSIVSTDFAGEATMPNEKDEKATKTIHPNRVVFKMDKRTHTLFAPGGDNRPLVRMGITTVARIARILIAVFDLSRDLESQFDFFTSLRFLPQKIIVALNKADVVERELKLDLEKRVDEYSKRTSEYFKSARNIAVEGPYVIVAEKDEKYSSYNDNGIQLILDCIAMEMKTLGTDQPPAKK